MQEQWSPISLSKRRRQKREHRKGGKEFPSFPCGRSHRPIEIRKASTGERQTKQQEDPGIFLQSIGFSLPASPANGAGQMARRQYAAARYLPMTKAREPTTRWADPHIVPFQILEDALNAVKLRQQYSKQAIRKSMKRNGCKRKWDSKPNGLMPWERRRPRRQAGAHIENSRINQRWNLGHSLFGNKKQISGVPDFRPQRHSYFIDV